MGATIEKTIDEIYDFIESCKTSGWGGTKVSVPKDELYELLAELKERTPDEIKRYQKIIANRDSIIAQAEERAEAIIKEAKIKAEQLVSENAIVQQAYVKSQEMISQASDEAAEVRTSAENDMISTLGMSFVTLRISSSRSSTENAGFFALLFSTAMISRFVIREALLMMSRWPLVTGSKLPGHTAVFILLQPPSWCKARWMCCRNHISF